MKTFAGWVAIWAVAIAVMYVFVRGGLAIRQDGWTPKPKQTINIETRKEPSDSDRLTSLRLATACADAGAAFWTRTGYAQPESHVTRSYVTHMNRSTQRCLIRVTEFMTLPDAGVVRMETVFDAAEGIEIGHTTRDHDGLRIAQGENSEQPITPALRSWFDGLMTR
jgi:hypothetical protein